MGISCIEFRGKEIWWGDGDIELWLYALAREVEGLSHPPEFLRNVRQIWQSEYSIGFGAAPDANLNRICTSEDRRVAVVDIAKRALATLRTNPIISKHELNRAEVGGDFHWTRDGSAAGAIELGRAFVDLLSSDGEEPDKRALES